MYSPFHVKKIAVLGAGVMGAQIAAHCVNAGIETLLFDLTYEAGDHNSIVFKAIENLKKLKPSPLATPDIAYLLQARNYDDNLKDLSDCDLVIEAIAERLDWKEALYNKISPFLGENSILVSNTSGLSINELLTVLPEAHQKNFCGVHFFNPPRYMHLAELIPANTTSNELLDNLESFLTSYLGKGVIRAKDTPNFIANRIGVFSLLATLHNAEIYNLGLDEVDALTGELLGRPKSATFRTMDVVGLDTMQHVVLTMQDKLASDPWHKTFKLPNWLQKLINDGHLGQKTGQGIYRKSGNDIEVYDLTTNNYRVANAKVADEVKVIMKESNPLERMKLLNASNSNQAKFLIACLSDLFLYSAYHLKEIADTIRDVDLAMRWGFGWKFGPFETWQASGFNEVKHIVQQRIEKKETLVSINLPSWLDNISDFYNEAGAFSPINNEYKGRSILPVYTKQYFKDRVLGEKPLKTTNIFENEGVSLWTLKDDIAVVNFKSKANTIGQAVLDGLNKALAIAESNFQGLVVYQHDAANFSSGADLKAVAELIRLNKMKDLEAMVEQFQQLAMRFKYSSIPTVAALRGRALGGGCELMLHCSTVVAAFESYPGLVEAGVGLIPAGGGCKEMALKASYSNLMANITQYFEQIAKGVVATSARDALKLGYLNDKDLCLMHRDEVLFAAFSKIKSMQAANYNPPLKSLFKIAGREGNARLKAGLVNWFEGGFISEHDYLLANELALVLCGGDLNEGELVDEAWMLNLEKSAFMRMAASPLTQARIGYLLETGKVLRN